MISKKHLGYIGGGIALVLAFAGAIYLGSSMPAYLAAKQKAPVVAAAMTSEGATVVQIKVGGGYSPQYVEVPAGKPVQLEMVSSGAYDCSSSLYIPSLQLRKFLPTSGVTKIDVPAQAKGTDLNALCGMGMYSFRIAFR